MTPFWMTETPFSSAEALPAIAATVNAAKSAPHLAAYRMVSLPKRIDWSIFR